MRTPIVYSLILAFFLTSLSPSVLRAGEIILPIPGTMVRLSPTFVPPILKGIKVHKENPFKFDFVLDSGSLPPVGRAREGVDQEQLKQESTKLIKYFLASLTTPEKDLWVNLSPYEKDRIVPESFGQTEMGRDLLAQDYLLKQVTASLIYPEDETGKKFWKRIYEEAAKKFGTTNIPVNTFNKVWIVPEKAVVYENAKAGTAYVVESRLKVMLEQDYLSLKENVIAGHAKEAGKWDNMVAPEVSAMGSQIVREIVIPALSKEINEGQNFAQLRQVYNSLILATWYKKKIKDSILSKVYNDKNKIKGTEFNGETNTKAIYQRYLEAFKKGAYNYIKEEQDPLSKQILPRKYFSGGVGMTALELDAAMRVTEDGVLLSGNLDNNGVQLVKADIGAVGQDMEIAQTRAYSQAERVDSPQDIVVLDNPKLVPGAEKGTQSKVFEYPGDSTRVIKIFNASFDDEMKNFFEKAYEVIISNSGIVELEQNGIKIAPLKFIKVKYQDKITWAIETPFYTLPSLSQWHWDNQDSLRKKASILLDRIDQVTDEVFGYPLADRRSDWFLKTGEDFENFRSDGEIIINFDPINYDKVRSLYKTMAEKGSRGVLELRIRGLLGAVVDFLELPSSDLFILFHKHIIKDFLKDLDNIIPEISLEASAEKLFQLWAESGVKVVNGKKYLKFDTNIKSRWRQFKSAFSEKTPAKIVILILNSTGTYDEVEIRLYKDDEEYLSGLPEINELALIDFLVRKIKIYKDSMSAINSEKMDTNLRSLYKFMGKMQTNARADHAQITETVNLGRRGLMALVGLSVLAPQRVWAWDAQPIYKPYYPPMKSIAEVASKKPEVASTMKSLEAYLKATASQGGLIVSVNGQTGFSGEVIGRIQQANSVLSRFNVLIEPVMQGNRFYLKEHFVYEKSVFFPKLSFVVPLRDEIPEPKRVMGATSIRLELNEGKNIGDLSIVDINKMELSIYLVQRWLHDRERSVIDPISKALYEKQWPKDNREDNESLHQALWASVAIHEDEHSRGGDEIDAMLSQLILGPRLFYDLANILRLAQQGSVGTHADAARFIKQRVFDNIRMEALMADPKGEELLRRKALALYVQHRNQSFFDESRLNVARAFGVNISNLVKDEGSHAVKAKSSLNGILADVLKETRVDPRLVNAFVSRDIKALKADSNSIDARTQEQFIDMVKKGGKGFVDIFNELQQQLVSTTNAGIANVNNLSASGKGQVAKSLYAQITADHDRMKKKLDQLAILFNALSRKLNLHQNISVTEGKDRAMAFVTDEIESDSQKKAPGGIDLNADKMNLQTQNAGEDIRFDIDPAMLQKLQDAPGFTPNIISITPMTDLRGFLGAVGGVK